MEAVEAKPVKVKPRFRGVSHFFAFFLALGGFAMLAMSPLTGPQYVAGLIYGLTLVMMFGLSALYHRPMWSLPMRRKLRKIDHSSIALLIAGTYTPVAMLDSRGEWGLGLAIMWGAAFIVLLVAVFWTDTLRGIRATLYVALGFIALPVVLRLPALVGTQKVLWLVGGATIYLAGAIVYALRWPNPNPRVFGYHEVFHLMVIAAAAVQYGVVLSIQYPG